MKNVLWYLEVILSLMLTATASEYTIFDELGDQIGTLQHNLHVLQKSKRESEVSPNIIVKEDEHQYYNSKVIDNSDVWIEINPELASEKIIKNTIHEGLSSQFRYAYNVKLPFIFPYYGIPLQIITPTTGGFIFVGELIHNQLTETHYIAPLMAEFDPSMSEHSYVYYHLTPTRAIVQWENVMLHSDETDSNPDKNEGFTFQAQLYINGDIIFAYKKIPYHPAKINNQTHYVKVGIAEAYYESTVKQGIPVTFVHQFHSINIDFDNVGSGSEVILKAEESCLSAMSCAACTTIETNFDCSWCPKLQQCGDGFSRWRQRWTSAQCIVSNVTTTDTCPHEAASALPSKHTSGFYEMQICQESKMALVCTGEDTVIIEEATFSRQNYHGSMCEGSDTKNGITCAYDASIVKRKMSKTCNNKSACFVQATKDFFGADPCPGYEKTLIVYYKCSAPVKANNTTDSETNPDKNNETIDDFGNNDDFLPENGNENHNNEDAGKEKETVTNHVSGYKPPGSDGDAKAQNSSEAGSANAGKKIIIAFILIIIIGLLVSCGAWFAYAYKNPTSPSGLWLIKYGRFWRSTAYKEDTNETGI